ncbi:MAG: hypothetical protein ACRDNZ_22825 [Streptosporangiaceae bacterium]
MTSAELAVFAALGSSALTAAATLGVTWFREWLRGRAAARDTPAQLSPECCPCPWLS